MNAMVCDSSFYSALNQIKTKTYFFSELKLKADEDF